jgi:hypothetical protein
MDQNDIPPPPPGFELEGSAMASPAQSTPPQNRASAQPRYNGPMPSSANEVFDSLVAQESGGRAGVRGPMTQYGQALGRTQVLPSTARGIARNLGIPYREDLLTGTTPEAAAYQDQLGRAYLEEGFQKTGNAREALMYYHGGPDRNLWGPKTQRYADEVLGRWSGGSGAMPAAAADMSPSTEMVAAPPPPEGFEIADAIDPSAQQGTRQNPIDLREKLYNDQIPLLVKGAWAINKEGQPFQLTGDAFQGQPTSNSEFQPGSNTYIRPPNAYDATEAFATAASEQVPFLDEAAALAQGAMSGRGYSDVRDEQRLTKDLLNQTNRGARNLGGVAGFGLSFAAPGAGFIGRGTNAAEKAIRATQVGGGLGALYGAGAADGGLGERAQAGLEGGALGAVTGGLLQRGGDRLAESIAGRAANRASNPSDARILSNAGVDLTPGQMAGGAFKRIEDGLTSIPFMGDAIKGAQRRGLETFNDAAINDTLAQIGSETTRRGRGRMQDASQAFSRSYDEALNPVTEIPRPDGYVEALTRIADDASMPPTLRRNLRSLISNTVGRADEAIDGQTWKRIDSELSADIRAADRAAVNAPEQRLLRDKLNEVRGLWSERLGAVSPEALAAVRNVDDAYATFKIIQKATSDVASAGRGAEASPATMNRAVRQAAGEGRYSRGGGRLQTLSDAAAAVLPSSVPDSGTPLRSLLTAGGLGGGAAAFGNPVGQALAGLSALGIGAGSAAYSSPVQRAVNSAYRAIGRDDTTAQALSLLDTVHQNPAAVPLYMQLLERLQQDQGAPANAPVASLSPPLARAQAR